jgi:hypothetical protein
VLGQILDFLRLADEIERQHAGRVGLVNLLLELVGEGAELLNVPLHFSLILVQPQLGACMGIRRRLRSFLWKQWKRGPERYAELTRRGVGKDLAIRTVKSPHGPW